MSTCAIEIPEKRMFRADEVAKILDVSVPTIYRWCEHGKMDFIRIGGSIRIKRECIISVIRVSE